MRLFKLRTQIKSQMRLTGRYLSEKEKCVWTKQILFFSSRDVQCDGAVLVTTPQAVAVGDVRRELTFCKKTGLKVLGILENMCGFVCPHCSECTNIFSRGGGESLAQLGQVPFLGRIPIDPQLTRSVEDGTNFIETFNQSATAQAFIGIVKNLITPPVESMEVVEK